MLVGSAHLKLIKYSRKNTLWELIPHEVGLYFKTNDSESSWPYSIIKVFSWFTWHKKSDVNKFNLQAFIVANALLARNRNGRTWTENISWDFKHLILLWWPPIQDYLKADCKPDMMTGDWFYSSNA
jgi:hypothetical protein